MWEMVREFDHMYDPQTNMSFFNNMQLMMNGDKFNQARGNFNVWCKEVERFGREKLC